MARTKAMTTHAKELAKTLSSEQMRQLAELLAQEAERPRVDQKELKRLQREIKAAYARLTDAEEKLSTLLGTAGKTNDEINELVNGLRRDAERGRVAAPAKPATGARRGRPRKQPQAA